MYKNKKKNLNHPSTYEWINRLWYIFTRKYYRTMKMSKLELDETTRRNVTNISC